MAPTQLVKKTSTLALATGLLAGSTNVQTQPIEKQALWQEKSIAKTRPILKPASAQDNQNLADYLKVLEDATSADSAKITALNGIAAIFSGPVTNLATISSVQINRTVDDIQTILSEKINGPHGHDTELNTDVLYYTAFGAIWSAYQSAPSAKAYFHVDPARSDLVVRTMLPRLDPMADYGYEPDEPDLVGLIFSYQGSELSTFNEVIDAIKGYLDPKKVVDPGYRIGPDIKCLSSAIASRPTDLSQTEFDTISNSVIEVLKASPNYKLDSDSFESLLNACPANLLLSSQTLLSLAGQLKQMTSEEWKNANVNLQYVGGVFTSWCFLVPDLFENQTVQPLFTLSTQSAKDIIAASPKWDQFTPIYDHINIFLTAQTHRGEAVIKTLFDDYNLTGLGYYSADILENMYINRNKPTGKPIVLSVIAKHNYNQAALNAGLPFYTLDQFDVRAIEASTDQSFLDFSKVVSGRLGGAPFAMVYFAGHGDQNEMAFKAGKGGKSGKVQDVPENLDLTDAVILNEFKPFIATGLTDIVFNSCAVGQGTTNLAQFVAQTLQARSFGAVLETFGTSSITFRQRPGYVEIDQVIYAGAGGVVPTAVFDYRTNAGVGSISKSQVSADGIKAFPNPFEYAIDFDLIVATTGRVRPAPNCMVYDELGRRIAQVEGQPADGQYHYHWDTGTLPIGTYFVRIEDGGKHYSMPIQKR